MATKQPSTLIEALNAFQQKYHAAGLDGNTYQREEINGMDMIKAGS